MDLNGWTFLEIGLFNFVEKRGNEESEGWLNFQFISVLVQKQKQEKNFSFHNDYIITKMKFVLLTKLTNF